MCGFVFAGGGDDFAVGGGGEGEDFSLLDEALSEEGGLAYEVGDAVAEGGVVGVGLEGA